MKKINSLVIPLLLITGCTANQSKSIKHNYHETKEALITWSDVFNQPEHDYLVYFYSERCGHCNEIKNQVIDYYLSSINAMYFVCTDIEAVFGQQGEIIGVSNIEEFYILGTPFLIEIHEYVVMNYYAGTRAILDFINK